MSCLHRCFSIVLEHFVVVLCKMYCIFTSWIFYRTECISAWHFASVWRWALLTVFPTSMVMTICPNPQPSAYLQISGRSDQMSGAAAGRCRSVLTLPPSVCLQVSGGSDQMSGATAGRRAGVRLRVPGPRLRLPDGARPAGAAHVRYAATKLRQHRRHQRGQY